MRPVYLLLRILLPYVMRIHFKGVKTLNAQKSFKTRTIFVSNHPSAFMDPLVVANFQWPIFHFMTRSDVFKPWLRPVTWAAHMVPVYRMAEDGKDSLDKNIDSFREAITILKNNKSLIMFGEGYTDDVFIRSLKPMKKGPARIGFSAMVSTNWELDILIQTAGANYSHPKHFRSDVVLSLGNIIHLKDYKELYDENPNKAITQLTRDIEKSLQDQITYVQDKSLAPFVEQIQVITQKGMNHFHHNPSLPLTERYYYSRNLASFVNGNFRPEDARWADLKSDLATYFADEKKEKINENWVFRFEQTKSRNLLQRFLELVLLLPVFLVGVAHNLVPYLAVKLMVEKLFRRDVFWSGVKLLVGALFVTLYNLPVLLWLYHRCCDNAWLGLLHFLIVVPVSLIVGYWYWNRAKDTFAILKVKDATLEKFAARRKGILEKIRNFGM